MNSIFTGETFRAWLENATAWLATEIFTTTTVVYMAMQIPALVGAGFSAWWVHDFIHPVLEARIRRSAGDDTPSSSGSLWRLIFPGLWLAGLWISIAVAAISAGRTICCGSEPTCCPPGSPSGSP